MLVGLIIRLILMLALAALQVLVLNDVHLFGYATPMLYVAFLLRFPLNTPRVGVLLWAFLMGLTVDVGSGTPGMGAAAMTLAGMLCQPLLRVMSPRDATDDIVATPHSMGRMTHFHYVAILVVVHHAVFYLLESFTFHHPIPLLISFASSALLSLVLIIVFETLRLPKA
ncbi:MAG: rod shape-determining protein MreD [Bacteroidaceae bacterium]|nr:rod shape-determining protein MreD [Bacteroidaceae bacterium]